MSKCLKYEVENIKYKKILIDHSRGDFNNMGYDRKTLENEVGTSEVVWPRILWTRLEVQHVIAERSLYEASQEGKRFVTDLYG